MRSCFEHLYRALGHVIELLVLPEVGGRHARGVPPTLRACVFLEGLRSARPEWLPVAISSSWSYSLSLSKALQKARLGAMTPSSEPSPEHPASLLLSR